MKPPKCKKTPTGWDIRSLQKYLNKTLLKAGPKKMSKKMIQATIDANGGEDRMRQICNDILGTK